MSYLRVRRHTDGRVALCRDGMWLITSIPGVSAYPHWYPDDRLCFGEGWSELLVAELPESDHNGEGVDDEGNDTAPDQWEVNCLREVDGVITAWTNGIEIEGVFHDADEGSIDELELDALKLLAAITEHRRCYIAARERHQQAER